MARCDECYDKINYLKQGICFACFSRDRFENSCKQLGIDESHISDITDEGLEGIRAALIIAWMETEE